MSQIEGNRGRARWLAGAATLLSLTACYGTLGVFAILSLLGVSLALNPHVWAAAIVAFALIAAFGIALGYRRHRNFGPLALAAVGVLLVVVSMYGTQLIQDSLGLNRTAIEVIGFAGLIFAAIWDWRSKTAGAIA